MRSTLCWMWHQSDHIDLSLDCRGLRRMTPRFNGALVTFNSIRRTALSIACHSHMTYLPSHLSSLQPMRAPRFPSCETHLRHSSRLVVHLIARVGICIPRRTPRFPLVSAP